MFLRSLVSYKKACRGEKIKTVHYDCYSKKIFSAFKIAHISDLHSCLFGENQYALIEKIKENEPDFICLTGDIFDERIKYDNAKMFLREIRFFKCPVFFVTGNHEFYINADNEIKDAIQSSNIIYLDRNIYNINIGKNRLAITGINDPILEKTKKKYPEKFESDLKKISEISDNRFTLLLSHRPEFFELYVKYNFELVLSGHAHGGQWRLPPIINGLYAPHQGIFPKYSGGSYKNKERTTEMIVSRGLSKLLLIPRIFNPAEIGIINVLPN